MSGIGRFATFALINNKDVQLIRFEQHYLTSLTGNSMALGFPVHITLRGRFLAHEDTAQKILKNIYLNYLYLQTYLPTTVHLSEPKYIGSQLSWLEVLPNGKGFWTLLYLHQLLEKEVKEFIIEDEVPESHKHLNFRPHITLGWGIKSENWKKYSTDRKFSLSQTRLSHIALARYPKDWPAEESVNLILKIPI